jgi:hypothetical protein
MEQGRDSITKTERLQIPFAPFVRREHAQVWAKQHLVKLYTDTETGGKGQIVISKRSIDKYLSSSALEKSHNPAVHHSVLRMLPEVIKISVLGETHPHYIKVNNIRNPENGCNPEVTIQRLYARVLIAESEYTVKITIRMYNDPNRPARAYSFEVTNVE